MWIVVPFPGSEDAENPPNSIPAFVHLCQAKVITPRMLGERLFHWKSDAIIPNFKSYKIT